MEKILDIIKDEHLTFEQRVYSLARAAENMVDVLHLDDKIKKWMDKDIICDLAEGNAPYKPRYVVPDYQKFMEQGSQFLELSKPKDIWEAVNNLLILYKHVPSVTMVPVYLGNIDTLLEPFVKDEKEDVAKEAIKLFLNHIDKTITDSFCHADIGPLETKAGKLILEVSKELQNPIPNITIKYDKDKTSEKFAIQSIKTALAVAKPSFANDEIFRKDFNGDYAIASCYNGLYIGGGSYTLVRGKLSKLALEAKSKEDFFDNLLPEFVDRITRFMDKKTNFIVEESAFFKSNFLVKEGLVSRDKFTGMFGIVGLAECVNELLSLENSNDRFGHSKKADKLGEEIIKKLSELVNEHTNRYCEISNGHYLLHAQVGIDSDSGDSPGCRIPIGEEPDIYEHIVQSAPFHKYFPSGIGDIFKFDEMAKRNPKAILDIINGGFKTGLRYFSLYEDCADVIRITGYLVKKSEMNKLDKGVAVLRDTTVLGQGGRDNSGVLNRKLRGKDEYENGSKNV
ncbi:YjjI family glycine radical enzyme [Haliovirga abyssi]|uniref:YjjI family glycine radical enzyme n=1 Tax=Haliovirga abyssi TaxID=2996794 RepID=A0AAU9E522_9FUSO|nr:YjjI family glycine radical enzyme [Haliovirga abyssi]BDU51630.1 hypothetical protein HLVA_21990 [Haliovirga abyssi]